MIDGQRYGGTTVQRYIGTAVQTDIHLPPLDKRYSPIISSICGPNNISKSIGVISQFTPEFILLRLNKNITLDDKVSRCGKALYQLAYLWLPFIADLTRNRHVHKIKQGSVLD